ncbi:hypothetical protein NDU88_006160 [Pleurodeles waltl]|uniref:Uncharacterized protein n=1 Tax=Pleurodeles waltl TaxID=8319 RepID=A0AAV7PHI3_PLEWA|nr:hypothetical protein NDU88_006160 [Pleurodeles waltl]
MADTKDNGAKDKETKAKVKCSKQEPPIPESPVKDIPDSSKLEALLKKLHNIGQSTKTNTDLLQVEVARICNSLKDLGISILNAKNKISSTADYNNAQSKQLQGLKKSVVGLICEMAELEVTTEEVICEYSVYWRELRVWPCRRFMFYRHESRIFRKLGLP